MKKTLMFASCLLAAVAFTACSDDDNDNNGDGGATTPAPEMGVEAFNAKYDLQATLNVDTATFNYASLDGKMFSWDLDMADENGDSIPDFQGQYFVAADNEYVDKVLGFLDAEVFPVFGEEFISKYMPRTIYFASEVQYNPMYNNRELGILYQSKDFYYAFDGGICCPNYIMFSHCCSDFDTMDKTYLKRLYTSLVVEYIFTNIANSRLDEPTAFNQYSIDYTVGTSFWGIEFCFNKNCDGYYFSSADDFETGMLNYNPEYDTAEEIVNGENMWHFPTVWFQSELRPARIGVTELTRYDDETLNDPDYSIYHRYGTVYYRPSLAQVMGDYVAFIVTTTAAEKEAYYAEIENAVAEAITEDDDKEGVVFPATDQYLNGSAKTKDQVLPDIKARVELCKEYFANYGVVLTDKQ